MPEEYHGDDMPDARSQALDDFAAQKPKEGQILAPAVMSFAPPQTLVHGPQTILVPRDEGQVLGRIRSLAAAAGDAWYYRIPFKDKKTGKTTFVEGPSIKLANDVARIYGRCEADQWVSGEGIDYWEFTARFIDLESGYALTRVFRQRKNAGRIGGGDQARNDEIGFAIGASKAVRNVICNALQTFTDYAYEEARRALVNAVGKDIERWRREVSERIGQLVEINRVEAIVGRSVKDWLAPDIAQIAALGKAIKDGMATVDETFPPLRREQPSTKAQMDNLGTGSSEAKADDSGAAADAPGENPPAGDSRSAAASPPKDAAARKDAIAKLLKAATDERLDEQSKLETIDNAKPMWAELLDPEFLDVLIRSAVSVAKGHQKADEVRKMLEKMP